MKETFTTTVQVQGGGESKAQAFADALSQVQRVVLGQSGKVLLRIEPADLRVLSAERRARTERFLFLFLPRERVRYTVALEVTVNVTAIDAERVAFAAASDNKRRG
ncbi:cytoplasmic protein [Xenophilus sp. AP218F]|nr:cytoplasmic protein [Xenophilus sp. AP218F]